MRRRISPRKKKMTKETDSVEHLAKLTAQLRKESEYNAQQQEKIEAQQKLQAAEQRELYIQAEEKKITDLIAPGTTRDQLLDRIRAMREEKVVEVHDYYMSPEQKEQLRLEQEMGRAMVAKAEAEAQRFREARALAAAAAQGEMVPVHHPNPDQNEQYPAVKATLGKPSAPKQSK
jgi:hypothetical protein